MLFIKCETNVFVDKLRQIRHMSHQSDRGFHQSLLRPFMLARALPICFFPKSRLNGRVKMKRLKMAGQGEPGPTGAALILLVMAALGLATSAYRRAGYERIGFPEPSRRGQRGHHRWELQRHCL